MINLHRGYLRAIDLIVTASAALQESGRAKVPESSPEAGDTVLWTFERKHFPPDGRHRVRAPVAIADQPHDHPAYDSPSVAPEEGRLLFPRRAPSRK